MRAEDKLLDNDYEGVIYFENPDYEPALIGVSTDYRAVYDFDLMVEYLMENDGMEADEAAEFIDYNCVGFSVEDGPFIIHRLI